MNIFNKLFRKKEKKEVIITKNMTLAEVLKINKKMEKVLLGFGMACLHCPMSSQETLEEAAIAHEIDVEFLIKKLKDNA